MRIGILGGGSWGTALAILWSRHGHQCQLWVRNPQNAEVFASENRNTKYLPHVSFPAGLQISNDLNATLANSQIIALALPLQAYRPFLESIKRQIGPTHQMLLLSKGLELGTSKMATEIVCEILGEPIRNRVFVLSGPSFAKEVAEDKPTAVVLAGYDTPQLNQLQEALNCPSFRLYRNRDVTGVEMCGALKNVIAIASGMVLGLDLGNNAMAGLITRGLSEITRLGKARGAQPQTFSGLAGMGDLILTCTGSLSRNLRVGKELAKGLPLQEVLDNLGMVAEGVHTCRSATELAHALKVEMPITQMVYKILYEGLAPMTALNHLMNRSLKPEWQTPSTAG